MPPSTSTRNSIADLVDRRRAFAAAAEQRRERIEKLNLSLQQLARLRERLLRTCDQDDFVHEEMRIFYDKIQSLDADTLCRRLRSEMQDYDGARSRFSRTTLNIAVIGRARQGKSRLLQAITGLSSRELPDGMGENCTGVKSTIYNSQTTDPHGEVFFHDDASFIGDAIGPYYEMLALGPPPSSIASFASHRIPAASMEEMTVRQTAMYDRLQMMQEHLDEYRDLLGAEKRRIPLSQLREYVAQDTPEGRRDYRKYFAVRHVHAYCAFPNMEDAPIAVIDLPGLGDTGYGDEERLLNTLKTEVDFAFFVRMPRSTGVGDSWADIDLDLYDTANSSLEALRLADWSFLVLNKVQTKNSNNADTCDMLRSSLPRQFFSSAQCIVADCAEESEVEGKVLTPALEYLETHLEGLDREYDAYHSRELDKLVTEVEGTLSFAGRAVTLGRSADAEAHEVYKDLFDDFWHKISTGLERLVRELKETRDSEDEHFRQHVVALIEHCAETVPLPTEDEISSRRDHRGSYDTAYSDFRNEMRSQLSREFLRLDNVLHQSMEELKQRVVEILCSSVRLDRLVSIDGGASPWLHGFGNELPPDYHRLKEGFSVLAGFELSYRGFIHHRIRRELDVLTPDSATSFSLPTPADSAMVRERLDAAYREALHEAEPALLALAAEPSQAAFGITEEFVDRILRAKRVEREWDVYLNRHRLVLWPEVFDRIGELMELKQEWVEAVTHARHATDDLSRLLPR